MDPRSVTAGHLTRLEFEAEHDGFAQLRVGIPMFAQDPSLRLGKELYPTIASICGSLSATTVEHTIRTAIENAWRQGNREIWNEFFPGCEKCPSNKKFIARMAQLIASVTK